jgi:AmiR/NasT family two-component response regulator
MPEFSPMKKILIVDDDITSLALFINHLSLHSNYEVLQATNGLQAIELCRQSPPDLVILDVEMPGLSGIDVAAVLKTNLDIPFVFLSAHEEDEIINLAADSGALGYVVKPVEAGRFVPTIEVALKRATELKALKNDRTNLAHGLNREQDVAMAMGIIMVLQGMGQEQAFDLLRRTARNNRVKLSDMARSVIDGEAIEHLSPGFAKPDKVEK